MGRLETCKEDSDSDAPSWATSKKPRSSEYTGNGVGLKESFIRHPPPPPSPPTRRPTTLPANADDDARMPPTHDLQVINLTKAAPPPIEFLGYPVHQGVIVLPPETVNARTATKKEQDKGKRIIHSFPFSYPAEFPLELQVHVQVQKPDAEPVEMTLKLNRTASMKGVTRAVYNFKGGELLSVQIRGGGST